MDYIQLGLNGPRVSRIAFGNWSASPRRLQLIAEITRDEVPVGGPSPETV